MHVGLPKIYYGLHMNPGVAEYRPRDKDAFRVLINDEAIRKMGPTFAGRPLFIGHRRDADPTSVKQADGVVVESFFNKADGNHWVKFMVFTPEADNAIKQGYTLSNAYETDNFGAGGFSNGVKYDKEILGGEYNHLALVKEPRYENSMVLTPEDFKKYNADKDAELLKLANSKEREPKMSKKSKFSFFKRERIENEADFEETMVQLPKSGKEVTIAELIVNADDAEMAGDSEMMANDKHHVMFGNEKMTVGELREKHQAMCNEMASMKKDGEDKEKAEKEKVENEAKEKADKEKLENEKAEKDKAEKEKLQNSIIDEIEKAPVEQIQNSSHAQVFELRTDKVVRGQSQYGSAALKK